VLEGEKEKLGTTQQREKYRGKVPKNVFTLTVELIGQEGDDRCAFLREEKNEGPFYWRWIKSG